MRKKPALTVALSVAGSDSGGGAGIQADLKVFAALGVHGATAITCVTAQNPRRVTGVQACGAAMVKAQMEAVFAELPPDSVKTGMLFSAPIIRVVAGFLKQRRRAPLVVDPVMVATSGSRLLRPDAVASLKNNLLPLARLVTPNVPEAEVLAEQSIRTAEDMRSAARRIRAQFGCAVLVKGGHLRDLPRAADLLLDGKDEWLLTAPFIRGVGTHGTGCTTSAAIAGYLARGCGLVESVRHAKEFVTRAIAGSRRAGRHSVLHYF